MRSRWLLGTAVAALALLSGCETWVCDSTTCADGCCTLDGVCALGSPADKCGTGGNRCVACDANTQACLNGSCQVKCGPSNCPAGCCDANQNCVKASAQSNQACGGNGAACRACQQSESCGTQGCAPKCTANNCGLGCCLYDGTCMVYTSQTGAVCGTGGAACTGCQTSAQGPACVQGRCCIPGGQSCALGSSTCCAPNTCVPVSSNSGICQ